MTKKGTSGEMSRWTRKLFGGSRTSTMFVFSLTGIGCVIRLLGDHSSAKVLWANIVLLIVAAVGFTVAAFRLPKEPKVPQQRFNETGDLE